MGCAQSSPPAQAGPSFQDLDSEFQALGSALAPVGLQDALPSEAHTDKYFGAEALLESVAAGSIALVRGRWLVALAAEGGTLRRRQDLPSEAFFEADELRKMVSALGEDWGLLLVAISYRWLTAEHPDPDGYHLAIVARVAKLYLDPGKHSGVHATSPLVKAFECAGFTADAAEFGMMWDFVSLAQKPLGGGERTPEEAALFRLGLEALPIWYGHAETVMWMQPELPEGFGERMAALGLAESYDSSGWCFVESSVSSGIKHSDRRLNLGLRTKDAMQFAYGCEFERARSLDRVCTAQRPPPRAPEWVAQELRTTKKFTGKGDVPVVEALYRSYFDGVTSTATRLNFSALRWGDADGMALASVLPCYERVTSLDVSQNPMIGGNGAEQLAAAALAMPTLETFSSIPLNEVRADSLTALDLQSKGLGVTEAFVLADLLRTVGSGLTRLDISDNQIGDEGVKPICAALRENKTLKMLELRARSVGGGEIGPQGAKQIAEMLGTNGSLTHLDVSWNLMDRGGNGVQLLRDAAKGRQGFVLIDEDNF